jgi:hypothetical protein
VYCIIGQILFVAPDGPRLLEVRPPAFSRQRTNSEYKADMFMKYVIPYIKYGIFVVLRVCVSKYGSKWDAT